MTYGVDVICLRPLGEAAHAEERASAGNVGGPGHRREREGGLLAPLHRLQVEGVHGGQVHVVVLVKVGTESITTRGSVAANVVAFITTLLIWFCSVLCFLVAATQL